MNHGDAVRAVEDVVAAERKVIQICGTLRTCVRLIERREEGRR